MCGIVAAVSFDCPIDQDALSRALRALSHRGPDGSGVWISPDRRAGLAHARLSIIDLAGGAQPLANEDGTVRAVLNGELYDFERMRSALERDGGHRFATRTDSEVLLHLYEDRGVEVVRELRGELAFALWDARARCLFAGRDRFGAKPLFYAWIGSALWIASEAKALLAAGVPRAWDRAAFLHAARLQYVPPERTLFGGIRQLPPGCRLSFGEGDRAPRIERYWDFDYPCTFRPPEIALVRERLEEAVRVRLRADVPVCFQLSGGLDSTAVAALASRSLDAPIHCFTLGFEGEAYDELPIARASARSLGAVLHEVPVCEGELLDHLPDAVYFGEGLAINAHLPAKYLLLRAIREAGFKVVLSGEGSDEIFAGYPHFRRDLILTEGGDPAALEAENALTAGVFLARGDPLPLELALGFVPSFLEAKLSYGRRMHALLADHGEPVFDEGLLRELHGRHPVHQAMVLWSKLALANYILRTLGDGMEMAHGVEGRLPYLDHHLFDAVRAISPADGIEKRVLREAMRTIVPEAVLARRKHPLIAPPIQAFARPGAHALVDDLLRSGTLPRFFDAAKVRALLDQVGTLEPAERIAVEPVLMTVLTACILERRFGLAS